ncbi:hypothetical protein Tco_0190825 [Tanacetum coccineum]
MAYRILWIRRIDLVSFVVFSEMQPQIRLIFLDGYGVLVVRTLIFIFLRLSSRMRAFLLSFTKYSIITPISTLQPEPYVPKREGKGIATDEQLESPPKLVKASFG